jgi:hypothetical protein
MGKTIKIFLGLLVMALCYAAGTLFGPAQAQTYSICNAGRVDLVDPGFFGIKAKYPDLKITKVERESDHTVYITVVKR